MPGFFSTAKELCLTKPRTLLTATFVTAISFAVTGTYVGYHAAKGDLCALQNTFINQHALDWNCTVSGSYCPQNDFALFCQPNTNQAYLLNDVGELHLSWDDAGLGALVGGSLGFIVGLGIGMVVAMKIDTDLCAKISEEKMPLTGPEKIVNQSASVKSIAQGRTNHPVYGKSKKQALSSFEIDNTPQQKQSR